MTGYLDKRFYSDQIFDDDKGAVISSFDVSGQLQAQFVVKPGFRLFNWICTVHETKAVTTRLKEGHPGHSKMPILKKPKDVCYFVLDHPDQNVLLFYYTKEQM